MKITQLLVASLAIGSVSFAQGQSAALVEGRGSVQTKSVGADFQLYVQGQLENGIERIAGRFVAFAEDQFGNQARLRMTQTTGLQVQGADALITGSGWMEVPLNAGGSNGNNYGSPFGRTVRVLGTFRILVHDGGDIPEDDAISILFDNPSTPGVDLAIGNSLDSGFLEVISH